MTNNELIQEKKDNYYFNSFKHLGASIIGLTIGSLSNNPLLGGVAYIGVLGYAHELEMNRDNHLLTISLLKDNIENIRKNDISSQQSNSNQPVKLK